MDNVKHYDIKVYGKVQGVFFRSTTTDLANELNIKGRVKNEQDGSVFIQAEGSQEKLNRFIEWCQNGPENAEVERVETSEDEVVGFQTFKVDNN
jgi:acylphosphatase